MKPTLKQKLIGLAFIALAVLICVIGCGELGGGTGAVLLGAIGVGLLCSKTVWVD